MNEFRRTWCEIDLDQLQYNIDLLRRKAGKDVFAVVKANAYGHGDRVLTPKLQELGVRRFAVSNCNEAATLRKAGITGEVLILGYTPTEAAQLLAKEQITQTVFSTEYANALEAAAAAAGVTVPVHLKLDTGMGRIGFDVRHGETPLAELLAVCRLPHLKVTGIFTHFACADSFDPADERYTDEQTAHFDRVVQALREAGVELETVHIQNSAGILNRTHDASNAARMGIALYGLKPSDDVTPDADTLRPLLSWKTTVELVKELPAGDCVSYGRTYTADTPRTVATLAAGYADGYLRAFSNRADVLISGKRCPVIGRVCMDQMLVDVTGLSVQMGDTATLIGTDGSETITADELASIAGTINYEIVCNISRRVPRIYFEGGQVVAVEDDSTRF